MKDHIKKVLNIRQENSTLDRYVTAIFNLNNSNPTYVFRLPDKKKLTFRKSDFDVAVFPNITNVNKFTKSTANLQMQPSMKHQVKVRNEQVFDELKHERIIFKNNFDGNDDYDDNMRKIIDENVRSEKDFIHFMNDLNDDLSEESLRDAYHQRLTSSRPVKHVKKPPKVKKKISEDDGWEELGLSGWSGILAKVKSELPKKQK